MARRLLHLALIALVALLAPGCAEAPGTPADTQLTETPPAAYVASKADLPWSREGLAAGWRDTMVCAAALGDGVADGAQRFAVGLWHLPGMLAGLIGRIGREVIQRTADLMMAATDEEALARIRATTDEDKRRLLELLATIRRSIPELWLALDSGTDWFGELNHDERVQLVCEVTGRVAFEVLIVIAGDKGLSKLIGMSRVQLVHGIQSRALDFITAARLARLSKRAIVDVGAKIAGQRQRRRENPEGQLGPLASAETYDEIARGGAVVREVDQPSLGSYDADSDTLTLHVHDESWSETPGNGYLDVFLRSDGPSPSGAIPVTTAVPFELVASVVRSLEPDVRLWGDRTLDVLSEGITYQRYLVPADVHCLSETSPITAALESRLGFIVELAGEDIRPAVESVAEYLDLPPRDRVGYLDALIDEIEASL